MIHLKPNRRFLLDFRDNQIAGFWCSLCLRRTFDWLKPSVTQFLVWSLLGCLAVTLLAWLQNGDNSYFNIQGLVAYAIWPFIALIVGIFLSQRIDIPRLMFAPAILWLVLDVNIVLFQCLITFADQQGLLPVYTYSLWENLFFALFIWQCSVVVWVFARSLKWPWWELILIILSTIITAAVWQSISRDQPIWKLKENYPTLPEAVIYDQPKLLNNAFDLIQSSEFLQKHWYFFGIAGSSEDVFRSEVERISSLFTEQWGTKGRTLSLINNTQTFDSVPIATRTSIQDGLNIIANRMNRSEDVLFLYLTSHGAADIFQLEVAPINMQSVDPKWLRTALDNSGIQWRVIVISACFSGSFIPELASPKTIIITAARADKQSFGCNNEADYTYFGRAFFDQAMRNETSIIGSFDQAKTIVSRWEQAQGLEPSLPQIKVGKEIQKMLPEFEKSLFMHAKAPDQTELVVSP